jgi:hypothetical protein
MKFSSFAKLVLIFGAAIMLLDGCALVGCNHAFPQVEWYWSADAKACRKEHAMEAQWRQSATNNLRQSFK